MTEIDKGGYFFFTLFFYINMASQDQLAKYKPPN